MIKEAKMSLIQGQPGSGSLRGIASKLKKL